MLKALVIVRIVFTVLLLLFPVWFLFYFLGKQILSFYKFIRQKIDNVKALEKIKNDLLQQTAKETRDENNIIISEETIIANIFETTVVDNDVKTTDKSGDINAIPAWSDWSENKIIQEKQKKLLEKISYEANIFKKEWKLEEYEKKLIEWLAIDPENLELNKELADLYFTIWNHKKALSLLKKIIEVDPEDNNVIWQIWEIYLIMGDYETAELLIEKAINLKPNNPKYYISMVEILYNTDRKKDAIATMEKIVKLRPTNSNYALTLAELYEEIEDFDNAKKYYFKVLEQEPTNDKAKRKIQEYSLNR